MASLFSLHRPLSVTSAVPVITSPEAFSSIFASRKSGKPQTADVIYTLTSTLSGLESAVHQQQQQHQQQQKQPNGSEEGDLRNAVTQASVSNAESSQTHLDGVPLSNMKQSIQEFAKQFRPFNPPPAPIPMGSEDADIPEQKPTESADGQTVPNRYNATLTIRESTNPNGLKTYSAHTSPLIRIQDEPSQGRSEIHAPSFSPVRYLGRLRIRRERMHALSVKRQRKLKMKKHKYKKLMRRTRNLRRRLDRN